MKNSTLTFLLLFTITLFPGKTFAQLIIWSEDFSANPCAKLCLANTYTGTNGAWTSMDIGTQSSTPNEWYISGAENADTAGACEVGNGNKNTLHVSNVSTSPTAPYYCPTGDCGSDFDAGSFGGDVTTDKRAASPIINLSNYKYMTLNFLYVEGGTATVNNMTLDYSIDGGTTWTQLDDPAKTNNAGCENVKSLKKGKWTKYSIALPAAADNQPNFKLGFHWVNGTTMTSDDPSTAISAITITTDAVSGINQTYLANAIEIFPNPFSNTFTIKLKGQVPGATAIVYDITGKEIFSTLLQANQSTQVDIPGLPNGIYLLKVTSNNGYSAVSKLIKAE